MKKSLFIILVFLGTLIIVNTSFNSEKELDTKSNSELKEKIQSIKNLLLDEKSNPSAEIKKISEKENLQNSTTNKAASQTHTHRHRKKKQLKKPTKKKLKIKNKKKLAKKTHSEIDRKKTAENKITPSRTITAAVKKTSSNKIDSPVSTIVDESAKETEKTIIQNIDQAINIEIQKINEIYDIYKKTQTRVTNFDYESIDAYTKVITKKYSALKEMLKEMLIEKGKNGTIGIENKQDFLAKIKAIKKDIAYQELEKLYSDVTTENSQDLTIFSQNENSNFWEIINKKYNLITKI